MRISTLYQFYIMHAHNLRYRNHAVNMAVNLSIYLFLYFIPILVKSSDLQQCINGFTEPTPHNASERGHENFTTLRLIPGMNFSCNGEIVWLTIAGQLRSDEQYTQCPKLYIWRKLSAQWYIRTDSDHEVALSSNVCSMETWANVSDSRDVYECSLEENAYVSFQCGDFIGLELPPRKNATFLLYFTEDGPTNAIYFQGNSRPFAMENTQPQITLGIRNLQWCMNGFTEPTPHNTSIRGHQSYTTVRVIPGMNFSCNGETVWLKVAGQLRLDERYSQYPKLQIWRRSSVTSGFFIQMDEVALNPNVCITGTWTNVSDSSDVYQCSLEENAYVSFQHGDFIALELPPQKNAKFLLYFTTQDGPTNTIYFRGNSRPFATENTQPQITLGIRRSEMVSTTAPEMTSSARQEIVSTAAPEMTKSTAEPAISPMPPTTHAAIVVSGAAIALVIAIVLLIAILMVVYFLQLHRKKRTMSRNHSERNSVVNTYPNPVYCINRGGTEIATADYDEINDGMHTEKLSFEKHQLEADYELTTDDHELTNSTLTEQPPQEEVDYLQILSEGPGEDTQTYWKPAGSINELYKQLSSKKYREIIPNQLELTGVLGSGEFGRVSKGVWESPMGGMDVAVKQLQPGASEEEKVKFLQEAAINGQFRHPNVVKLMGVVTTGEPTMIVLELLPKGDLGTLLKQLPHVDQQELLRFCQQIASGMEYLSKKGFVHRDLAARNILVSGDHICKISDFGMSRNLLDDNYYISHGEKVPVKWTAPEAIHYMKYSPASDVWSFGCVIYEIWSLGHKPFEINTNPEVIKMVDQGHRLPPTPGLTKELYKIMMECWQPESSRRPTFSQLVEMLSRADFELFAWEEEDLKGCDQRVKVIGAPLELAQILYTDLQNMYK